MNQHLESQENFLHHQYKFFSLQKELNSKFVTVETSFTAFAVSQLKYCFLFSQRKHNFHLQFHSSITICNNIAFIRQLFAFTKYAINTLTANYEYSRSNRENLPLPIQMHLPEKSKTFSQLLIAFLESTLNFKHLKKISLTAQVFLKLLTPKDVLI